MAAECDKNYEVLNPNDRECAICAALNRIYHSDGPALEYRLPAERGRGSYLRLRGGGAIDIGICDFRLEREVVMAEHWNDAAYHLSFCLAETIDFAVNGCREGGGLRAGESCVYSGGRGYGVCRFLPGRHYYSVNIGLFPSRFGAVLDRFESARAVSYLHNLSATFRKFPVTPTVAGILRQLVHCPYGGSLQDLYLEGKSLELAAAYLHEMVAERAPGAARLKLSREDRRGLERARQILDQRYDDPPTIAELAKRVYLNEFKLKSGFKEIYGRPVYAYVRDKRMEVARELLEEGKLRIKEVAGRVGYTNLSHFGEAFRQKFGINPGAYLRSDAARHRMAPELEILSSLED